MLTQVLHGPEESAEALAFAAEPVIGSLANILASVYHQIHSILRQYPVRKSIFSIFRFSQLHFVSCMFARKNCSLFSEPSISEVSCYRLRV